MRWRLLAAALAIVPAAARAEPTPGAQTTPGPPTVPALTATERERAARLIVNSCSSCHGREMLFQQRLTLSQWQATVKKMRSWGAVLNDQDADLLARHLATIAGPEAGAEAPPLVPADAAAAAIAPKPDGPYAGGDPAKGKKLYETTCAECHGAGARGSSLAVNLVNEPILYRADDFATQVRRGRGLMRGFPKMTDHEIAALLAWLRSVPP